MIRVTYYIGCNDKDTLILLNTDDYILSVINSCFNNYIITEATGKFLNEAGLTTNEKTFIITLLQDENDKEVTQEWIEINCNYLKHKLNQESILVTREVIQSNTS